MYLGCSDLLADLGYQYIEIVNNNTTHISSVAMHVGTFDMHIFFP